MLLVTHDQDLLEEVGTRVWHFEDGRIVDFKGSHEELTSQLRPRSSRTPSPRRAKVLLVLA